MKYFNAAFSRITLSYIFLIFFSCDSSSFTQSEYIDPHIIFSSRRWWNYDIFISDIYGGHMTQLTKNKWIDFNPSISSIQKNFYLSLIEMEIEKSIKQKLSGLMDI